MTSLIIREASKQDRDAVIALWRACDLTRPWNDPDNDFGFALDKPSSHILIAFSPESGCDPTHAIGTIMVGHDGHRGWFYYLAVTPDQQGQGFGKQLLRAAEEWLLAKGIWKAHLMVRTGNEKVIRFYEDLGYNVSETQVMERWIDPSKRGDNA
ncbi:GNAT family acetyltransferase [Cohaesibacter sp. CAU 1516]|uniref:GNAT family acetyltransferase n=1 Tax=Cohaesibacter sp. CAU 1516 TaxID=2576038 RepID=UPI0010FE61AD|nr:GNAT family acetyltransferase [Cohaesibacter sp. CAU 1516]TLP45508.1 GNAT family acetyltransferase [Cohaesibacter sp. CAU 1516]